MGLFFWKDNKKNDAFANAVADDLYSNILPEDALQYFLSANEKIKVRGSKKTKKTKTENKLASIVAQIHQYRETNSLGIYGKARLQMVFTSRLEELGYDASVVKKLNEIILIGQH